MKQYERVKMAIDTDVLQKAKDKKFTDFSKAVKQELNNKLSNHKTVKTYVSDYDKIQQMKKAFADIARQKSEPEVTNEPEGKEE